MRTHVCEAFDELVKAGDGDVCTWTTNEEQHVICTKSRIAARHGAIMARFSSYNEYERMSGERMEEEEEEEEDGDGGLGAMVRSARDEFEAARSVSDTRRRRGADDHLAEAYGMARELKEVKRTERYQAAAGRVGRKGETAPATPSILDIVRDPEEKRDLLLTERQRAQKKAGFSRRDVLCSDTVLFPKIATGLRSAFSRTCPLPLGHPFLAVTHDAQWKWLRWPRANRPRKLLAQAFTQSMRELVSDDWMRSMRLVVPRELDDGIVDLLGRWAALVHVTAPRFDLVPLRVFAAYVCHAAGEGVDARDGLGNTWRIIPPCSDVDRAALFEEPMVGKKRKTPESGQYIRALYLPPGPKHQLTCIQLSDTWERLANVIQAEHFTAPWYWDWFTLRSRRCWPLIPE